MTFLPAGFIDGSRVPGEMLRRLAYASTKGETAVVESTDLRVAAQAVPNATVSINAGTGVIVSKFPNAPSQVYIVANDAAVNVNVPTTAGTWLVYAAIRDPQYPGQTVPGDPLTNSYTDILVTSSYPVNQPYMPLASIANPTGAAAITNAMITDTRVLGRPRRDDDARMLFPAANTNMSKSAYTSWPLSPFSVTVPTWATKLRLKVTVNGVESVGAGTTLGGVRVIYHNSVAQNGIVQFAGPGRQTVVVIGEFAIPLADRGQSRYLGLQGYQTVGSAVIQQDYQSQVLYEWTFIEDRG